MSNHKVGEVRPSQLLWTYGPGALIDLPNISVITMGLDRWNTDRCTPIEEARLLAAVRQVLGPQVNRLLMPPFLREENVDPLSSEGLIGVPVRPFPRWLRCVKCGLLAEYDKGLFELKTNPYKPDQAHFVHSNCPKGKNADAVPARFLLACKKGHLDDFPWHWFVHSGQSDCKGTLRFFERGASLQTENLWVKCDSCDAARSLVHAFGQDAKDNLPACRGRHPHLNKFEDCDEEPRTILLGASNGWFPETISVLAIPLEKDSLGQLVLDAWEDFREAESVEEIKGMIKSLSRSGRLPGIDKWTHQDVWKVVEVRRNGETETVTVDRNDIKGPEWDVFSSDSAPSDWPHFLSVRTPVPTAYRNKIIDVLLLERLREVNALIGYTRIESPDESMDADERPEMASLSRSKPEWVPATEVHGEGIFIRFDEAEIRAWETKKAVERRSEMLEAGYRGWRNKRKLDPDKGYPGIRYALLHTFAHLLIRELALECGYNAASIKERIYSNSDGEHPMAGVLIYTAAADSDGTLGGLVELGKAESLGRIIKQALERAKICSSDPLCSKHDPGKDQTLHAAACHACTFIAETSCEKGNRYLDRALLLKTFESEDAAFFDDGQQ